MVSLVSTPSPCTRLSSLLFWRSTAQAWCVRAVCVCVCVRACEDDGGNSYSSDGKTVHQSSLSLYLYMYLLYTLGTSYDASLRSLHLPT